MTKKEMIDRIAYLEIKNASLLGAREQLEKYERHQAQIDNHLEGENAMLKEKIAKLEDERVPNIGDADVEKIVDSVVDKFMATFDIDTKNEAHRKHGDKMAQKDMKDVEERNRITKFEEILYKLSGIVDEM